MSEASPTGTTTGLIRILTVDDHALLRNGIPGLVNAEPVARGARIKKSPPSLAISEETVKSHITKILAKLRANDRTHAVTIGLKRGIIDL